MLNGYSLNDFCYDMPLSQPRSTPFASPKHKRSGSIDFDYSRRASSGGESTYSLYTRTSATPPDSPRVSKVRPIDLDKVTQASLEFQRKLSVSDLNWTAHKITEHDETASSKFLSPEDQYFAKDFDLKEFLRCNPVKRIRTSTFESTYLPESSLETIHKFATPDAEPAPTKKTVVTKVKLIFRK